jgi:hypothetical protein
MCCARSASAIVPDMAKPLPFRERMKRLRDGRSTGPDVVVVPAKRTPLEVLGHISQVAVAVVAIFGYFYTVRPVYQKERLEEEVAKYEQQIIKYEQQIEEHEPKVRALEVQLQSLESSRASLLGAIGSMNANLNAVRAERDAIEEQIQFMAYRYRLPDGRPATTPEEVKQAQEGDLRKSFVSAVRTGCWQFSPERTMFSSNRYIEEKDRSGAFPFTQQELDAWVERGPSLPQHIAMTCVRTQSDRYMFKHSGNTRSAAILSELRSAAEARLQVAAKIQWSAPVDPMIVAGGIEPRKAAIRKQMEEDQKKVQEEYGNWKSVFGESRRVIYKHNYEVGMQNAKTKATGDELSLTFKARSEANVFRDSLNKEVDRLINAAWE